MANKNKSQQPPRLRTGSAGSIDVRSSRAFTLWTEDGYEPPKPPLPPVGWSLWTRDSCGEIDLVPNRPVLIVLQPMASGRHVKCRMLIQGTQSTVPGLPDIICKVGSAAHFRSRMEIRGAFQEVPTDPHFWTYLGKLPRRCGFW